MPITKGAKKAVRSSERKWAKNIRRRRALKGALKQMDASETSKDKAAMEKDLSVAYKALDKAAKTGIIKKNTASRKKSRLAKRVAKASA